METICTIQTPEFESYFAGCVRISHEYGAKHYPNVKPDAFRVDDGKRYLKIVRGDSVHAFVDKLTGDVLKPASFKIPAKHARGNIFSADNGLGYMSPYGPAYLR